MRGKECTDATQPLTSLAAQVPLNLGHTGRAAHPCHLNHDTFPNAHSTEVYQLHLVLSLWLGAPPRPNGSLRTHETNTRRSLWRLENKQAHNNDALKKPYNKGLYLPTLIHVAMNLSLI